MLETLFIALLFIVFNLIFIFRPMPIIAFPVAVITFYVGSSRMLAIPELTIGLDIMMTFMVLIFCCVNMYVNALNFSSKKVKK